MLMAAVLRVDQKDEMSGRHNFKRTQSRREEYWCFFPKNPRRELHPWERAISPHLLSYLWSPLPTIHSVGRLG
jgi:hypothetical protein